MCEQLARASKNANVKEQTTQSHYAKGWLFTLLLLMLPFANLKNYFRLTFQHISTNGYESVANSFYYIQTISHLFLLLLVSFVVENSMNSVHASQEMCWTIVVDVFARRKTIENVE